MEEVNLTNIDPKTARQSHDLPEGQRSDRRTPCLPPPTRNKPLDYMDSHEADHIIQCQRVVARHGEHGDPDPELGAMLHAFFSFMLQIDGREDDYDRIPIIRKAFQRRVATLLMRSCKWRGGRLGC